MRPRWPSRVVRGCRGGVGVRSCPGRWVDFPGDGVAESLRRVEPTSVRPGADARVCGVLWPARPALCVY
jgi:hypothetical protein